MSDAAVRWDVSVKKTLESGGHRFALDVAFSSDAARLVLFGPSGAGKSLTLRAIAGLLRPDQGAIALDGEALFDSQAGSTCRPASAGSATCSRSTPCSPTSRCGRTSPSA